MGAVIALPLYCFFLQRILTSAGDLFAAPESQNGPALATLAELQKSLEGRLGRERDAYATMVGFSAGGGFDAYSRAIARHWGKHIPGNPTIIVENMTGAGSLIAANHVYNGAKPDGLTIGHFIGGLFLGQVLGQKGIEFDARKFEYIGAPLTFIIMAVAILL